MVSAKPVRPAGTPAQLRRLAGAVEPRAVGEGRVQLERIRGSGGELKNVSIESRTAAVKFVAEVDTGVSQVGRGSSWDRSVPVKQIEKGIEIQGKGIVGRETRNGLVSAELKT